MDELFIPTELSTSISIESRNINNKLDDIITKKLKNSMEGKCVKNGYIRPNSIKILKRSMGNVLTSQFNGSVLYNIIYVAELCNPLEGASIEAQVLNINKMGVLAGIPNEESSPLNILLAKQHHIDNVTFENLKEGDIIQIKVIGKRYEFGDSQISIIGILHEQEVENELSINNDNIEVE